VILLAVALIAPQTAGAAYDPVGGGETRLTFSSQFLSLLAHHHVNVHGMAGAEVHGRTVVLPAKQGEVDPRRGAGTVESSGVVVFAAGSRLVKLRRVIFETKHSPLLAKVGGGQLKLVTARKLIAKRSGFGSSFAANGLRLTAKVAQRLNKKLNLGRALSPGQLIGKVTLTARPKQVHLLAAGRLSLALATSFSDKLNSHFVSINPIAPAELGPGPALSLPVEPESILAPDGSSGLIKLGGSVELLQLGSAQFFWRQLQLEPEASALAAEADLQPSPPQAGRSPEGPLLMVQPGQVLSDPQSRVIEASGQTATLSPATAAAMNSAFAEGKPLFAAGEVVGTLSAVFTGE